MLSGPEAAPCVYKRLSLGTIKFIRPNVASALNIYTTGRFTYLNIHILAQTELTRGGYLNRLGQVYKNIAFKVFERSRSRYDPCSETVKAD